MALLPPASEVLRALIYTVPHRALLDPHAFAGVFPHSPYLGEGMKAQQRGLGFGSHSNSLFTKPQLVPYSMAPRMTGDLWLKQAISLSTPASFFAFIVRLQSAHQKDDQPLTPSDHPVRNGTEERRLKQCLQIPSLKTKGGRALCVWPYGVSLHN